MIRTNLVVEILKGRERIMSADMKKPALLKQVADLQEMDASELKQRWRELFDSEPPAYGRSFMMKRLAYRIQELAYGGVPGEVQNQMDRIVHAGGYDGVAAKGYAKKSTGPIPGTLLIREWKGRRHEVVVMENGFEYGGRPFRSLSAVAAHITGTKWNGPAFFGLRENGGHK